jgi:hypothetical protein
MGEIAPPLVNCADKAIGVRHRLPRSIIVCIRLGSHRARPMGRTWSAPAIARCMAWVWNNGYMTVRLKAHAQHLGYPPELLEPIRPLSQRRGLLAGPLSDEQLKEQLDDQRISKLVPMYPPLRVTNSFMQRSTWRFRVSQRATTLSLTGATTGPLSPAI